MLGSPQMAEVKPFRAERYDESKAGPLEQLVAPPYDVLSPEQREQYLARSPYNVVHLTLPDDEPAAARLYRDWLESGVLARDDQPSTWWLEQDYVGPDGVARSRGGFVASLRAEPYSTGAVRPHERTHAGPKEGRLRLLRATHVQLEPIFLLYEGALSGPGVNPGGRAYLVAGAPGDLDTRAIEPLVRGRVSYTPNAEAAIAAVDHAEAGAAFLLRPPTIQQVAAVVERGETMPQKSTYFF